MNVSGGYERFSTNGRVQGYNFCFEMKLELMPYTMPRKALNQIIFYPPRLHRPLITVVPH